MGPVETQATSRHRLRPLAADLGVLPGSVVFAAGVEWAFGRTPKGDRLVVAGDRHDIEKLSLVEGHRDDHDGLALIIGPVNGANAGALRANLPWLRPRPVGLGTSAGFGDRLGLATPGHVRALREVGGAITPIFAQQSIREMTRTGRSPQVVIDDATWGAFEAGWTDGQGADADHLKTPEDISACAEAGFTWFTIDPSEHVDERADIASAAELRAAWDALPWARLEDSPASLRARFLGKALEVECTEIRIDEGRLVKAAVKYGRAVAHIVEMSRHVAGIMQSRGYDLEVSVDETDAPTSHAEHVFIASELRRLGVRWVSLAPRFVGRFEKGVDYIGDVFAFDADIRVHAAIARAFGPYKVSLHSGSDKFSIYKAAATHTRNAVHLKTAGTSYLEALRTAAQVAPDLFRSIYAFARERYEEDRASYHVSASIARAPHPGDAVNAGLGALVDDFHVRQILHVTFGSVLTATGGDGGFVYADPLRAILQAHPDVYEECLARHFVRHLRPFALR